MELDEYILRDIFRSLIILEEFDKEDLDFWENYDNQMVPIDEKYKRGSYSISEIETAD